MATIATDGLGHLRRVGHPKLAPPSRAQVNYRPVKNARAMGQIRVHFLAFVLLTYLTFLSPARAAVRFDVFPGYDGIVPEASWFPFVFEVANDGPGFNAIIEVVPSQYESSHSRSIAVELPTGTTKRMV